MPSITGVDEKDTLPGAVLFEVEGTEYRLDVTGQPGDERYFVVFGDATSGRIGRTSGGSRADRYPLWQDPPGSGLRPRRVPPILVEAMTLGDRVAVLHDGRLQQVARLRKLYERPANVLVAGFIGSPPMNLFAARVAADLHWIARVPGMSPLTPNQPTAVQITGNKSTFSGGWGDGGRWRRRRRARPWRGRRLRARAPGRLGHRRSTR